MQWNNISDDLDAETKRVIRYHARKLVGRTGINRNDVEDLEQELAAHVVQCLRRFDPTKASRKTFISRIVEHEAGKILRYRSAERRDRKREQSSLDLEAADTGHLDWDDHEIRTGRRSRSRCEESELKADVGAVISTLPPELQAICERLKRETKVDVGNSLGMPRSTFNDRVMRPLRAAFEAAGLHVYFSTTRRRHATPRAK